MNSPESPKTPPISKPPQEPCGVAGGPPKCGSKKRYCSRETEYCVELCCTRHCPCKQKLGKKQKKRKYVKVTDNCDKCNPTLARCDLCGRCSRCCARIGNCLLKTPAAKRPNHEATMKAIKEAQAKTPFAMKLQTGELESKIDDKEAQLFELLGIDKSCFHNLPGGSLRKLADALDKIGEKQNKDRANDELVLVLDRLYKEMAKVLFHDNSKWLMEKHFLKLSKAYGKDMEKRGRILEGVAKEVVDLAKTMPRNTMGYRIARAILVSNATGGELCNCFDDLGPPKFGYAARKRGKEDMDRARKKKLDPEKKRRTLARLSDDNVLRIVKHVLSFVQTLSWGTKTLRQSGKNETITFPKVTRTAPVQVMFEDFARKEAQMRFVELDEDKDIQPPQRTLYFRIAAALTSKAEKSISCIDYVMDILINVPVSVLVLIIEQVVAPTEQKRMKELLRAVQHFLKYQYDSHLSNDSSTCSHNINHALGLDDGTSSTECNENERCAGCTFVEYFMLVELPDAVKSNKSKANGESVDDALIFIEDSLDKFRRYQGHRVRVVNQQQAIAKIDAELRIEVLKTRRRGTKVKITIDYKQKYLEKRLRSSQMNDFGQRGITWHIVIIEYYEYEAPCEANGFEPQAVRVQVPLDQILNSGNKQDGPCVLAMLDAMLKMIKVELPFVKEAILVSDNANCYHSKDMIFSICILNQLAYNQPHPGPMIMKYIHPETQDGKGPCDSHAAVAGRHVDLHFICTRKDGTLTYNEACTPTEVANALCTNGGVKNSAVQLIELDFPRLERISEWCSGADEKALEYFARANEIRFFPELDRLAKWSKLDLMDEGNWAAVEPLIQVLNYSNISEGTVFKVGFADWKEGNGSFTPVAAPDHNPDWKKEIQAQAIGKELFELAKRNVSAQQITQSLFAQAKAHMKAACIGEDLFQFAIAAMTGSNDQRSEEDDDNNDFGLEGEVEDDMVDDEECWETYFEIEQALETRLELEENEFQYDQSWDSDMEDDDDADVPSGQEEDLVGDQGSDATTKEGSVKEKNLTALVDAPQEYNKKFFFTGVDVTHYKPFRALVPTKPPKKKKEGEAKKKLVEEWDSRAALDTAIGMAVKYVNSSHCYIRPALEEQSDVYKIADGWTQPHELKKGWARRPLSGGLYGKDYMNIEFKKICIEQFNRGVRNKGDKQSPNQTLELMKERHSGLYCYPGIHEIVRTFQSLVQQSRKNGGKEVKLRKKPKPLVAPEIKAELQSLVEANPTVTATPLVNLWVQTFGSNHKEYETEKLVQQANNLRQKYLKDAKRRLMRSMAG